MIKQTVARIAQITGIAIVLSALLFASGCDNQPQVDRTAPPVQVKTFTPPDPSKPIPKGMPKRAPVLKVDPVTGRPVSQ